MPSAAAPTRRSQTARSAAMKRRLVDAAIDSLIEHGYAHTTLVEICRRAGVTRGAIHHHFSSLAALLTDVLEHVYSERFDAESREPRSLEDLVHRGLDRISRPEFKAVIEIWLAARNDRDLGRELAPGIVRLSRLFEPEDAEQLAFLAGPRQTAFYHLCKETFIGLALGRATSPTGAAVDHEDQVIAMLLDLARELDRESTSNER